MKHKISIINGTNVLFEHVTEKYETIEAIQNDYMKTVLDSFKEKGSISFIGNDGECVIIPTSVLVNSVFKITKVE